MYVVSDFAVIRQFVSFAYYCIVTFACVRKTFPIVTTWCRS